MGMPPNYSIQCTDVLLVIAISYKTVTIVYNGKIQEQDWHELNYFQLLSILARVAIEPVIYPQGYLHKP